MHDSITSFYFRYQMRCAIDHVYVSTVRFCNSMSEDLSVFLLELHSTVTSFVIVSSRSIVFLGILETEQ